MKKVIIGVTVIVLAVAAFFAVQTAEAQDSGFIERIRSGFKQDNHGKGGHPGDGDKGAYKEIYISVLSDKLGISVDDLTAQFEAKVKIYDILADAGYSKEEMKPFLDSVHIEVLAQAVEQGLISAEDAERKSEHNNGLYKQHNRVGKQEYFGVLKDYMQANLGVALGVDPENFGDKGAFKELIEEKGVTTEEFKEAYTSAWEKSIDQALDDGVITTEQAEKLKSFDKFGGGCHWKKDKPQDADTSST
ncbi:MAG: hypothetical protein N2D54_01260 [Chloroflexota bacterium]